MTTYNTCPPCRCVVSAPGAFCHRCQSRSESAIIFVACVVLAVLLLSGAMVASCRGASLVDQKLMSDISYRESRNNPKARGKAGELGMYQLKPIAIREVNRVYGTKWQNHHALDAELAHHIAYSYLTILERRVRCLTPSQLYAVYRKGH